MLLLAEVARALGSRSMRRVFMMLVLLVGKCDGGRSHVVGDRWEVKVGVVGF